MSRETETRFNSIVVEDSIKNVFLTKTAFAQYAVILGVTAGFLGGTVDLPTLMVSVGQATAALATRRVTNGKATFSGR